MPKNKNINGSYNICGPMLKQLREQRNMTQRKLGDEFQDYDVDLGKNAIQLIECGKRAVNDVELKTFARFFSISTDELLGMGDEIR